MWYDQVYSDFNKYVSIANRYLTDVQEAENAVSDCVLKLLENKKNTITPQFFCVVLKNHCINLTKKNTIKIPISDNVPEVVQVKGQEVCIKWLNAELRKFASKNNDNKFHVAVFKYLFYGNTSVAKLSRISNIDHKALAQSRDYMAAKIRIWLREKQHKESLKDWATP